jgi:hypothetical protein
VTDVFLGIIAIAVLTMAVIQVAAAIFAARAARQMGDVVSRFESTVQPILATLPPILANLQAVSADAARASAAATTQVERAGQLLQDLASRVDQTVMAVQESILRPARRGIAFLHSVQAVLGAFRSVASGRSNKNQRSVGVDEEDALFIG